MLYVEKKITTSIDIKPRILEGRIYPKYDARIPRRLTVKRGPIIATSTASTSLHVKTSISQRQKVSFFPFSRENQKRVFGFSLSC